MLIEHIVKPADHILVSRIVGKVATLFWICHNIGQENVFLLLVHRPTVYANILVKPIARSANTGSSGPTLPIDVLAYIQVGKSPAAWKAKAYRGIHRLSCLGG